VENRTRRLVKRRSVYVYGVRFCTLLHRGNYIYRRSANGAERNKSFLLLKKNSESIKRANFCTVSPEKESIYGAYAMYECMYVWKTLYYTNTCTALTDTDTLTNRARHTDFPCKRRILNYGTENIFGNEHTDFCISTELRRSIPLDFVR
jgi:hypothetical protein